MRKYKFSLTQRDYRITKLIPVTNHKVLAQWAIDCAERVMPYFETQFPEDNRPRHAIDTLKEWIRMGEFQMKVIRWASLDSHAAAKEIGNDSPAASAAHAAGQAVATAHVKTHSIGPAQYALQALSRKMSPEKVEEAIEVEREWQYQHLIELISNSTEVS